MGRRTDGRPAEGRAEFKSLEAHLGLRRHHGFGDSAIEADTESDQAGEGNQIRIQGAKQEKEAEGFGDKVSEQKSVNPAISRRAVFIIAIKHAQSGIQKPKESNSARDSKGENDGQGAAMIVPG